MAAPVFGPAGRVAMALYRAVATVVYAIGWVTYRFLPLSADSRQTLGERLGHWQPPATRGPVVWLHAASVGEVRIAGALARELKKRREDLVLVLSCNTATGRLAAEAFELDRIFYLPLDHPRVVGMVLDRLKPVLFVFVETEIWPTLLSELARRSVASVLVNARISSRSFPVYRRVRAVVAPVLASVSLVLARDEESASRLLELGLPASRMKVSGDIKFDSLSAADVRDTRDLLEPYALAEAVLLAASTRDGEEAAVVGAYVRVLDDHPGTRLVVAPRHPERVGAVESEARQKDLRCVRWSRAQPGQDWDVLIVDSVGQLRGFMKASLGCFVGGTISRIGGHNLLEPAAFGLPVVCGPHLDNVRDQAELLERAGALILVTDPADLARVWSGWLADPDGARASGARGQGVVATSSGALASTAAAVVELL